MSNEVIIDGCNVAACSLYNNGKCLNLWNSETKEYDKCNSYCDYGAYFRQELLQRAKAELEQYKKSKQASYEAMQAEWNKAVNELRDLKASDQIEFKQFYKAENERLKAENEKLKAELDNHELKKDI